MRNGGNASGQPDAMDSGVSYRAIVESCTDAIWTFDRLGRVTWENRRALELTRSRKGHRGMSYRELVEPEDLARADRVFDAALSGTADVRELRLRPRWVASVSAAPVVESGDLSGFIWFARDERSEKTRAELETRSAELDVVSAIAMAAGSALGLEDFLARSLEAVTHVPGLAPAGGVFVLDDEQKQLRLAAHRGLPVRFVEAAEHVPITELLPEADSAANRLPILVAAERDSLHAANWGAGEDAHVILPLATQDRLRGMMLLYPSPSFELDVDARQLFSAIGRQLGVAIDLALSQGHEQAELSQRVQELERLLAETESQRASFAQQDRARTEYLAMISHDLRTPLNGIMAQAELLRLLASKSGTDWCRQGAERVLRVGRHMMTMVSDLAESVRLGSGEVQLDRGELSAATLIDDALALLCAEQRHRVKVELGAELPSVLVDRQRLVRALTNLLTNALKYSPDEKAVTVRVWARDGELVLSVEDSGVGIDPDVLPHIFEPFYRASDCGPEGIGLGLHIARLLVKAHGGTLSAASVKDEGSTFRIALPLVPTSAVPVLRARRVVA